MKRFLRVVFWNVHNLFREGAHPERGPRSKEERDAKLDALALVIRRLGDGGLPDILALAEVAEDQIVLDLLQRLNATMQGPVPFLFEAPVGNDTGLSIMALTPVVAKITRVDAEVRSHRPRTLSARVDLAGGGPPLYVIACHWKSDRFTGAGGVSPWADRRQSGAWLNEHLADNKNPNGPNGKVDAVIVMGDFNAEPYAPEIADGRWLHATRHAAKSVGAQGVRLFNAMWPWLVDPGASPVPGTSVGEMPRSLTSYGDREPKILDQVLVSRSILRVEPFCLVDVDYHRDADTARILPRLRTTVPNPWDWIDATKTGTGTSDHFPLVATLLY